MTWSTSAIMVVAVPLVVVNIYIYIILGDLAGNWYLSLLPGSLANRIGRLALLLAVNSFAISWLVIGLVMRRSK